MSIVKEAVMYDNQSMTFGSALHELKMGSRVACAGWNGKSMWLILIDKTDWAMLKHLPDAYLSASSWVGMKTADGKFVPWLCSQTDMLAEDWMVVS